MTKEEIAQFLSCLYFVDEKLTSEFQFNPQSTGLFPPGAALGGCFPPPYVKLDPDILESWNLQGW